MKYVNQLEYTHWLYKTHVEDEGGRPSTVRSSGCGLCSAVMVADRLLPNCQFDIADAIDLSYAVEANHLIGTDYDRFAPAFAEKLGLKFAMTSDPLALRECLRTGGAAVAYVTGKNPERVGLFTHGSHYIAIIGEEPDGRIAVLDPSYKEGKYEEEGRAGKVEVKNGVIALCSLKVLEEEIRTHAPGFYLFWRK